MVIMNEGDWVNGVRVVKSHSMIDKTRVVGVVDVFLMIKGDCVDVEPGFGSFLLYNQNITFRPVQ